MSNSLYSVRDIRAIEQQAFARQPSFSLMQQAGQVVAQRVMALLDNHKATVLAVAGVGNNGGDACIAADCLRQAGYAVCVLLAANADQLPTDAKRALAIWQAGGGDVLPYGLATQAIFDADLIIDGLFGIGLKRALSKDYQRLIEQINASATPVLAVDVPSGLNADTGQVASVAIKATETITFFAGKIGLLTGDGRDYSGTVTVAPLVEITRPASGEWLMTLPARLPRKKNVHKGIYGTAVVVGGSQGMLGALVLAARAAAILGAGKVRALAVDDCPAVDWIRPDIMWQRASDDAIGNSYAVGMGMALSPGTTLLLEEKLSVGAPLLCDAGALTWLATQPHHQRTVQQRPAATILTPHPTEAARLLNTSTQTVNHDRVAAAKQLAAQWGAIVVLKGAGSVISSPDGHWAICDAGNAGLARAGSGDVLSGMIVALLAQGQNPQTATRTGVWLHAAAADKQAQEGGIIALNINQLAQTAASLLAIT